MAPARGRTLYATLAPLVTISYKKLYIKLSLCQSALLVDCLVSSLEVFVDREERKLHVCLVQRQIRLLDVGYSMGFRKLERYQLLDPSSWFSNLFSREKGLSIFLAEQLTACFYVFLSALLVSWVSSFICPSVNLSSFFSLSLISGFNTISIEL